MVRQLYGTGEVPYRVGQGMFASIYGLEEAAALVTALLGKDNFLFKAGAVPSLPMSTRIR